MTVADLERQLAEAREKLAAVEKERDELRTLLISRALPEQIACAEMGCPSCGETITARLGTELKADRDAALLRAKEAEHESARLRIAAEAVRMWLPWKHRTGALSRMSGSAAHAAAATRRPNCCAPP